MDASLGPTPNFTLIGFEKCEAYDLLTGVHLHSVLSMVYHKAIHD